MKELRSAVVREFGLERESEKVRFLKSRVKKNTVEVVFEYEGKRIIAFFARKGRGYILSHWWFFSDDG